MRYVSTTAESSDFPPPPSFLFLLETNCSWDEMMPFYRDARQKYVLQMFNSYSSEFPRLFRLRPGTTWMRSLQRKLWTHRKWSGWLNRTAPSSESAQLVSMWPWSGHQAPDAKTELRSETKLLLTKEPKQEVRFWMPTELQPQTPTLFSVSGGVAAHYSDVSGAVYHQRFLNPIQGREDARCNSELRGRGE